MCGIVGCVGKIWKSEQDAFKLLLQLDTIRGPHSTGVISVGSTVGSWQYLKAVGTPWELMEGSDWTKFSNSTHRVLCGHNRWATVGEVNSDNAHPFVHGNFIGVHNGTLRAQWRLKDHKDHDVDSSNIYYNMMHEGVEETLKKLDGALALVWYNAETHQLCMVRNSERPLMITKTEDGNTYFWASEGWMLSVALAKSAIKHGEIVEVEAGKLVTFDVPVGSDVSKLENFLPKIKPVEFYKYIPPVYDHTAHSSGKNEYDGYGIYGGHRPRYAGRTTTSRSLVPFVRSPTGRDILEGYLHKTVVFSVVGARSLNNQDFILCEVEDNVGADIRIFVTAKTKTGKLLLGSSHLFKAKVKGMTTKEHFGHYLTVDHRSIQVVTETQDILNQRDESAGEVTESVTKFSVYKNEQVDIDTWYRHTADGCGWCGSFPTPKDADTLTWNATREFFCSDCLKDHNVREFLN